MASIASQAMGQTLPSSPHTVFKCEQGGQVVYTDQPCAGAERSELLKVRAERPADGALPHAAREGGPAPAATEPPPAVVTERPPKVAKTPRAECPHLAQRIALVEAEEQRATSHSIRMIQERLSVQRKRYSELGCSPFWVAYTRPGSAAGAYASAPSGLRSSARAGDAGA
jgi:hypothetical protein